MVLWERAEEHPGGEVFVAGRTPVLSGMTRRVQELLHSGRLELVNPEPEQEEKEEEKESEEQREEVGGVPPVADLPPADLAAANLPAAVGTRDDELLLAIDGISAVRLQLIKGLGVNTLVDLLAFDSTALADALPRVNLKMVEDWKAQAQSLLASNPQP